MRKNQLLPTHIVKAWLRGRSCDVCGLSLHSAPSHKNRIGGKTWYTHIVCPKGWRAALVRYWERTGKLGCFIDVLGVA